MSFAKPPIKKIEDREEKENQSCTFTPSKAKDERCTRTGGYRHGEERTGKIKTGASNTMTNFQPPKEAWSL
jgi:hypothetical protein